MSTSVGVALEVAGQHLERHRRACRLDPADGLGPVRGAAVGEIVAIDAGDHGVLELEPAEHLGDAARLVRVGGQRAAGGDVAEPARPRADVAEDHDRQRAAVPALADVRAARALAHGVQLELLDHRAQLEERRLGRQRGPDPLGVAPPGRGLGGRRLLADDGQVDALGHPGMDTPRYSRKRGVASRAANRVRIFGSAGLSSVPQIQVLSTFSTSTSAGCRSRASPWCANRIARRGPASR